MEPQQPVIPPPQPQIKNSLVFILSFLLIITVAIAALFYFQIQKLSKQLAQVEVQATPTPIPTTNPIANWKTYSDKKGSFSFKYPESWSFEENKSRIVFGPLSTTNHVGETVPEYVSSYITLDIYTSTQNTSLLTFKNISSDLKPEWNDFKIGEISGKEVRHLGCLSGNCREILFQKNNLIFNFFDQNDLKELDQILSTFKFLEATPSASPSTIPTSL